MIETHIGPFGAVPNAEIPVRSRVAIRRVANNAIIVETHRRKVARHLVKVSLEIEPLRARINTSLSANAPARAQNIPLIALLARSLDYPDRSLPADLVCGMDIVGSIPAVNAITRRESQPSANIRALRQGLKFRNRISLRSLAKPKGRLLRNKCWELSMPERGDGWLSEPIPSTNRDRLNPTLSPRFCIAQQHGAQ